MATINTAKQEPKTSVLEVINRMIFKFNKRKSNQIIEKYPLISINSEKKLGNSRQEYERRNIETTQARTRIYFRRIQT